MIAVRRLLPISLLLGLLVPACSTETVPTGPLELPSPPSRILGLVTADGAPVSGVTVTLSRGGSEIATVRTTGNGEFGFSGIDAGTYTVAISEIAGMRCSRIRVATVVAGEAAVVSFPCVTSAPPAALGAVEGRVTVNGVAARGVLVSISDASRRIAWGNTAADGTYRFPRVPTGARSVWISTEEPCPGTQQEGDRRQLEVTVSEEEVAVADFACTGQAITGRVAVNGISESGWTVYVCQGPSLWDDGCLQGQATDSDGRYAYTSLRHHNFLPGVYFVFVQSPLGGTCPALLRVPVPSGVAVTVDVSVTGNFDCEIDLSGGEEGPGSEGVGSVTIIPESLAVGVYESQQLTAIVRDTTGAVIDDPQVTFYSIGLPRGTVDSSGLVTGLPGGCGIGYVVAWSGGVKSNTAVVTIGTGAGAGCWDY